MINSFHSKVERNDKISTNTTEINLYNTKKYLHFMNQEDFTADLLYADNFGMTKSYR